MSTPTVSKFSRRAREKRGGTTEPRMGSEDNETHTLLGTKKKKENVDTNAKSGKKLSSGGYSIMTMLGRMRRILFTTSLSTTTMMW